MKTSFLAACTLAAITLMVAMSDPSEKDQLFDPMEDKVYRHPTFYELPESVNQM